MAKGSAASSSPTTAVATPATAPLRRSSSSTQNMKNQRSILGFFQKSSPSTPASSARNAEPASSPAQRASEQKSSVASKPAKKTIQVAQNVTPLPSSDMIEPDEEATFSVQNQVSWPPSWSPAFTGYVVLTDIANPVGYGRTKRKHLFDSFSQSKWNTMSRFHQSGMGC